MQSRSHQLVRRRLLSALSGLGLAVPVAATLAVGTTVTAQQAVDRVNGIDAVNAMGDRLPAIAIQHGMKPAELADLLVADATLWLFENDRLVFVDTATDLGHGLGRKSMPETLSYSVVAAVTTLWLAARAEGIGLGWVSILDPDEVARTLDVPTE